LPLESHGCPPDVRQESKGKKGETGKFRKFAEKIKKKRKEFVLSLTAVRQMCDIRVF
jgi:hypothetical protein